MSLKLNRTVAIVMVVEYTLASRRGLVWAPINTFAKENKI
jgi:hypothetical protein